MIHQDQTYRYVIWKDCKYWYPDRNRRFRLGRISDDPQSFDGELLEVFDNKYRKWVQAQGHYVVKRPAKLKEIMEAQE